MSIRVSISNGQRENSWYDGRAAANRVETLAWRYMVAAHPYARGSAPSIVEERFSNDLAAILVDVSTRKSIDVHSTPSEGQLTAEMRRIRNQPLDERIKTYSDLRLKEKETAFSKRADEHSRKSSRWATVSSILEFLGLVGAAAKFAGAIEWDALGIAAAGTAAVTAWLQLRQHQRLAKSYSLAVQGVGILRGKLDNVKTEEGLQRLVSEAEELFDREYVQWRADHEQSSHLVNPRTTERKPIAYFVMPTLSHSEYYSRLHLKLEIELERQGYDWQLAPPALDTTPRMYDALWEALRRAGPEDVVIFVPKEMDQADYITRFELALGSSKVRRVVFLDQQPPGVLWGREGTAMVGPDNRKVGLLAAAVLYGGLESGKNPEFRVFEGPGGVARAKGFKDGIRALAGYDAVSRKVGDFDRFKNLDFREQFNVKNWPGGATDLGIFACNDETAFAIARLVDSMPEREGRTLIASCDALREMMFTIRDGRSPIIASIDTQVESQVQAMKAAINDGQSSLIDPVLFPPDLNLDGVLNSSQFASQWNVK